MNREKQSSIKQILAAALVCLVFSIGTICLADEKGTVTVESAKIRESADTSSNQVGSVPKGGTVDIIGETTGTDGKAWYQVYVDAEKKGYIRADLVEKSSGGTSNTNSAGNTSTPTTSTESKRGTVVNNNVRIRKEANTQADNVVATANRGMVVTVTGETTGTDGNKWYQISFTYNNSEITGYIRSDLVTFENVPADTAVSEITGEENNETPGVPETELQPEGEPVVPEQSNSSDDAQGIVYMNVEETPYIMPGFQYAIVKWNQQDINAYKNGNFYILYARKQDGEEGWFLHDHLNNTYLRYVYTADDENSEVEVPSNGIVSGNIWVVVALAVVIVILLAVIALMFLKMKGNGGEYDEYDDEEDDDIDDLEEEFEEQEMTAQPVRRSARRPVSEDKAVQPQVRRSQPQGAVNRNASVQPMRRPAMPDDERPREQQPMRRMQSQADGEVTVRRRPEMEGRSGNGQGPRPANGQAVNRRPNGNGQSSRSAHSVQAQKGYQTRSSSENDDDLEFF